MKRDWILFGVIWVVLEFVRDFESLRDDFRVESIGWLVFTFVAGVIALLLTVPVFGLLLGVYSGTPIRYTYAARLLFVAQLLRHLPGRIWGVMYLVAETRRSISTAAMVRANVDVMFYSLSFNMLIAVLLFTAVTGGAILAGAIGVVALFVFAIAVKSDWIGNIARLVLKLLPTRAAKFSAGVDIHRPMSWSVVARIIACYSLSWGCYLLIWWALAKVFAVLGDVNIWLLCASYSVAWVLGYLAMITPAGLGVREAGFFALAAPLLSLSHLTFLAVFVRVWQLTTELLVFLMFAFAKRGNADDNERTTETSETTE